MSHRATARPVPVIRYQPTLERAGQLGELARRSGRLRVAPFYREFSKRDGQKIDITDELNRAWLKGYDSYVAPKLKQPTRG